MSGAAGLAALEIPAALAAEIRSAAAIVCRAASAALRPDPERTVDQWADAERQIAAESGSPYPGAWDTGRVPYLREIMRCLSLSHPARRVTFKKSAQIGGTEAGVNFLGQIIAETPASVLVLLPSKEDAKDYNELKLQAMIDATPACRRRVRKVKSRSGDASTKRFKKFAGGYLQIQGANSSKGLQMRTFRVVVLEEVSEYPWDVDGRGDPVQMAEARTIAESDRAKIFANSTPALAGACRISDRYEASSRGRYFVPCPHCGERQVLAWERLRWTEGKPETAAYACVACGVLIEHRHKRQMLAFGAWQHEAPELLETHPGFALNSLYSPFISWAGVVEKYEELARTGKLKVFWQQYLGEAWAESGDAPDHEKLHATRQTRFRRGVLPTDAILTVGAADVQGDRLEWAIWAFGAGLTATLVDAGIIPHGPTDPIAWRELRRVTRRTYPDERGRPWPLDAFGVDSGYHSQAVYRFALEEAYTAKVFALDGRADPRLPPLGSASPVAVRIDGKRDGTAPLWPVGTFGLKLEHYSAVRAAIAGPDETGALPPGVMRLGEWVSEEYARQLCSEYLETVDGRRGATRREWRKVAGARNEALDCAVYARALAHHLTAELTPAEWAALAAKRAADPAKAQGDLLAWWSDLYAVGQSGSAGDDAGATVGDPGGADATPSRTAADAAETLPVASPPHELAALVRAAPPAALARPSAPAGRRLGGVGRRLA